MESIKIIINKIRDGSIKQMWIEFKWMFSYAKKYKKEIVFYIFLGIFSTVMSLVSSIASKELIDVVTGHNISGAPMIVIVKVLVEKVLEEFEIDEETARSDVREFLNQAIKFGIVV